MKKHLFLFLTTIAVFFVGLVSSCSDDTPTTGTICITFSSWERVEQAGHVYRGTH